MKDLPRKPTRRLRCAVYTRKSSEEGLEQEFNSLHAQREACEAYIASQKSEGWALVRDRYDDGGISGGTLERPGLKQLLADIEDGLVDVVVVYKIDRLSRSLMDFSKLVEVFDRNGVTFVSVIRRYHVTDAAVHDSQAVEELLTRGNTGCGVWADAAYRSAEIETALKARGLISHIHRKGKRGKPLTEQAQKSNRTKSSMRVRVEHIFGAQANDMGGTLVRTIGLVRAKAKIGMKNLAYNMRRLGQLGRLNPCPV